MDNDILVSCTVLSYNSAKTIVETLESIKNQTYQNIELIVSDDCSKDDTVKVCGDWIEKNKSRFKRTLLLTVPQNTGVSANGNRALAACQGVWQKGIAADDILLPNCVEDFVDFFCNNPQASWASSFIREYKETFEEQNLIKSSYIKSKFFFDANLEDQLRMMARNNLIFAPSLFFKVSMKKKLGGYNTDYAAEDYPFYIKALEHGYKCFLMEKETVCYRIHQSQANSNTKLFNYKFNVSMRDARKNLSFKYLTNKEKHGMHLIWKLEDIIDRLGMNKKTRINESIYEKLRNLIIKLFLSDGK